MSPDELEQSRTRRADRYRAPAARFRQKLLRRERLLFDVICEAGARGCAFPTDAINVNAAAATPDPRTHVAADAYRVCGGRASRRQTWDGAARRLARRLANELESEATAERRPMYVLTAHATIGLAPDCAVPRDPLLRAAWKAVVQTFAILFPSTVKRLPRPEWVDRRLVSTLRREAAAGIRRGRRASGKRPGPEGRRLAVDPRLLALAAAALGKQVSPDYVALYLIYTKPGDHFWPHPDDPKCAPINLFVCIDRKLPAGRSRGSAFLAFRPDGSVERYELAPGDALVFDGRGLVHGREPLRRGERVVLLSIWLNLREGAVAPRAARPRSAAA
ncbi:MAG: hypothetical protein QOD06_376 [Candidatus Binatota bacterium]|nr:hypothetical protein [Candidatus Binatota bacterium]